MAGVDWGIEMFKVVDMWTIDRPGLVCGVDWGYRDVVTLSIGRRDLVCGEG